MFVGTAFGVLAVAYCMVAGFSLTVFWRLRKQRALLSQPTRAMNSEINVVMLVQVTEQPQRLTNSSQIPDSNVITYE